MRDDGPGRRHVVLAVLLSATALPFPSLRAQDTAVVRSAVPTLTVIPGSVRGAVYDSLARGPLANARVQLVSAPGDTAEYAHNVRSDDRGQFRLERVMPGSYVVTFIHPLLDSLGLEAPVRRLVVRERRESRVDLATPSARHVMLALCPAGTVGDSTALLLGHVRDAGTRATRPGGSVLLSWSELSIGAGPAEQSRPSVRAVANASGWFAVCNLPTGISLLARAAQGADTSGSVILELLRDAHPSRPVRWRVRDCQ